MVLPGETNHDGSVCSDCKCKLNLQVCHSYAGYYLGTQCECGPYSRESGYYPTREMAEKALAQECQDWRR